jgi:hypothetical protein
MLLGFLLVTAVVGAIIAEALIAEFGDRFTI